MAKRKFTVEVIVDFAVMTGLEFEIEAETSEEAELEAADRASKSLEDMSPFERLEYIKDVIHNGGSIHLEIGDTNVLSEEEEEEEVTL